MSVNPDIHDRAYQFFVEEAVELLQIIEDGILELRRDRGANTVHAVMRAAHSIKGGAASVELEAIKTIAHRMETAFRALYDETVEIDDELETLLLQGYDRLQDPLKTQIDTGTHDPEAALAQAIPVLEALEAKLGPEALHHADSFIPSSSDLGVDMVLSIFEIDVAEGIAHLQAVAENPAGFPVLGELQAQAEVFVGFGELLELPGFGAIAQAILDACHQPNVDGLALLQVALTDLQAAQDQVMGGERQRGGDPSPQLLALAQGKVGAPSTQEFFDLADFDGADDSLNDFAVAQYGDWAIDGFPEGGSEEVEEGIEEMAGAAVASESPGVADGLQDEFSEAAIAEGACEDVVQALNSLDVMAQLADLMADESGLGSQGLREGDRSDDPWEDADLDSGSLGSEAMAGPVDDSQDEVFLDSMWELLSDSTPPLEKDESEAQLLEKLDAAMAAVEPLTLAEPAELAELEAPEGEVFEAETFVQGFEAGTYVQDIQGSLEMPEADCPAAGEAIAAPPAAPPSPLETAPETAPETALEIELTGGELLSVQPESFAQGTWLQDLEATLVQGESSDDTSVTETGAAIAADEINPELAAFIAEAAAESARIAKATSDSPARDQPAEQATKQVTKQVTEQATEPMDLEAADSVLPELSEESLDQAFDAVTTTTAPPVVEAAPYGSELPSLESLFSGASPALDDTIAGLPLEVGARLDFSPAWETDQLSAAIAPEETALEGTDESASAIAQPEASNAFLTDTAVQMALAEHQSQSDLGSGLGSDLPSESLSETEAQATVAEPRPLATPQTSAEIAAAVQAVEQMFGQLPAMGQSLETAQIAMQAGTPAQEGLSGTGLSDPPVTEPSNTPVKAKQAKQKSSAAKLSGISVRVDLSVLERMNNLVGELILNRNSLSLQQEQLQSVVVQLTKRFSGFGAHLNSLRQISDQMLVTSAHGHGRPAAAVPSPAWPDSSPDSGPDSSPEAREEAGFLAGFDALEMDRYSTLHSRLQEIFEDLMQLEEGVDDIGVLLEQSTQSLTRQRQRMSLLQNELMWARMLPLDSILGRFPRLLRDMATQHGKSVDLTLNGTSILVDKGILEKLHDPMLHLLRNAFDHGIEMPETRRQQDKPERGEIQINAYYQGNQTVIEIKDDGQGINLERIAKRAVELKWLSRDEVNSMPPQALVDFIFEPGFSTAAVLSDLSGRGVGLDVVREQIKALKGNVTVSYKPGQGTVFTLRLPLTLTVAKLMICQVGSSAIALPSDGIEDLLVPTAEMVKWVGNQRFLHWRNELIPIQPLTELLTYHCPLPDISTLKGLTKNSIPVPQDWAMPLLILSRGQQRCALEVNRLLMEQELVIKPFGAALTPPEYSYGCTILGDGRMIPVLDGLALLSQLMDDSVMATGIHLAEDVILEAPPAAEVSPPELTITEAMQAQTILVVDDSTAMRRTMALSLEKAGYRVVQAGDGQEALTQLRQSNTIQLVICDVEMPNMNGFEFLSQRRREPQLMAVPVVMLTSRSSDKHRRLAKQLKAHDYFSKPYVEQEFLKSIQQILAARSPQLSAPAV